MPHPHAAAVCCPRAACLCSRSVFFFRCRFFAFQLPFQRYIFLCCILWVTWQWQQIFHVVNGSDRWLAAKLAMPKAAMMTATATSAATEAAAVAAAATATDGNVEGGAYAAQTQFAWKILLVAVHVLNIIHTHTHLHSQQKQQQWIVLFLKARIKHICIYIVYVYILHSAEPGLG